MKWPMTLDPAKWHWAVTPNSAPLHIATAWAARTLCGLTYDMLPDLTSRTTLCEKCKKLQEAA